MKKPINQDAERDRRKKIDVLKHGIRDVHVAFGEHDDTIFFMALIELAASLIRRRFSKLKTMKGFLAETLRMLRITSAVWRRPRLELPD